MSDLGAAIGLVIAIEGILYALFPNAMKQAILKVIEQSDGWLRVYGLLAATAGVGVVWLVRG